MKIPRARQDAHVARMADFLGRIVRMLTPIVMLHRFYSLVEACARALGRDPDNPPHLRKVTETK